MYRPMVLAIFVGLTLSACVVPPEVSTTLSDPDQSLFDQRLAGVWYAPAVAGPYFFGSNGYFRVVPRTDRPVFDIIGHVFSDKNSSALWLRATAYASQIDGETYYNVKRVAWVGDDYTAEDSDSFLILKSDAVDGSAWFLRSMDPWLLTHLMDQRRLKVRVAKMDGGGSQGPGAYAVLDTSREELIALIREIGPDKLFSVITGPFYRISTEPLDLATPSGAEAAGAAKFGIWQVHCPGAGGTATDASSCVVRDAATNIIVAAASAPVDIVKVGKDSCKASPIEARVDDGSPMRYSAGTLGEYVHFSRVLLERMHFGRVLHIEYTACPGNDTKRVDLPLQGFTDALAAASAKSLAR